MWARENISLPFSVTMVRSVLGSEQACVLIMTLVKILHPSIHDVRIPLIRQGHRRRWSQSKYSIFHHFCSLVFFLLSLWVSCDGVRDGCKCWLEFFRKTGKQIKNMEQNCKQEQAKGHVISKQQLKGNIQEHKKQIRRQDQKLNISHRL